jgi:hypothetical protein
VRRGRLSIGKPLPVGIAHDVRDALRIVGWRGATIMAEIDLGKVAVQVLLAAMLVYAAHTALRQCGCTSREVTIFSNESAATTR